MSAPIKSAAVQIGAVAAGKPNNAGDERLQSAALAMLQLLSAGLSESLKGMLSDASAPVIFNSEPLISTSSAKKGRAARAERSSAIPAFASSLFFFSSFLPSSQDSFAPFRAISPSFIERSSFSPESFIFSSLPLRRLRGE